MRGDRRLHLAPPKPLGGMLLVVDDQLIHDALAGDQCGHKARREAVGIGRDLDVGRRWARVWEA
ncbi:hypothetical protein [Falsihalocynthiibacter arcticus]|uniref:hypothetical protein n=1 Tax=Falsihalocynthiibacter arcticus TaxID=1579316 RepID=UPI003001CD93